MNIRFAETKDIPAMIGLLRQVGQVHHRIRPDIFRADAQKYDEAALAELLKDPQRPIFVADEEGVRGYCFCILKETRDHPVLEDERTLYIDDLCVDENCRGQKIGKLLYEQALAFARQQGCGTVTLNVWQGNHSALAFYEKMGLPPRNIYMETRLEDDHAE